VVFRHRRPTDFDGRRDCIGKSKEGVGGTLDRQFSMCDGG
jgi:hypothetical protein